MSNQTCNGSEDASRKKLHFLILSMTTMKLLSDKSCWDNFRRNRWSIFLSHLVSMSQAKWRKIRHPQKSHWDSLKQNQGSARRAKFWAKQEAKLVLSHLWDLESRSCHRLILRNSNNMTPSPITAAWYPKSPIRAAPSEPPPQQGKDWRT